MKSHEQRRAGRTDGQRLLAADRPRRAGSGPTFVRRLLALELLEDRRPLSAEPWDLSLVDMDYPLYRTSLHESQWGGGSPEYADSSDAEAPPYPLNQTFKLHSNPTATKVVYLDFDGHVTTGTAWNTLWNLQTINTPAYSFQGGPSFSDAELEQIPCGW